MTPKKYYSEITHIEFSNRYDSLVNVSDKCFNLVINYIPDGYLYKKPNKVYQIFSININEFIAEYKDEWFVVSLRVKINNDIPDRFIQLGFSNTYYLCDQLDGLKQFLDDFNIRYEDGILASDYDKCATLQGM